MIHEPNIQIKKLDLFKFCEEETQINIYLEPINKNQGRLIILIQNRIFQRFFDGVGNSSFIKFIAEQTCSSIAGCFSEVDDNGEDHVYDFILKSLDPVWPAFINAIYENYPIIALGCQERHIKIVGPSGYGRAFLLDDIKGYSNKINIVELEKEILQETTYELTTIKDLNPPASGKEKRRERRRQERKNKR